MRYPILTCTALAFLITAFSPATPAQESSTSGYGPPTAIPPEVPITQPAAPPRRNWIDQTQAQADAKSTGCNQCHAGVEPMHSSPHVVLGCTDCHGGDAWASWVSR